MIRIKNKLDIHHFNGTIYTDLSDDLISYDRDSVTVTIDAIDDKFYIGFYKPINVFYAEIGTVNTNVSAISLKYYNGTVFTELDNLFDDTKGLSRSGFITWDRNQVNEAKTTINSLERYWYELTVDVATSAVVIKGLNIVFSDDLDIKREIFEIDNYLPSGEASHILAHVAARDEIIQSLRRDGRHKQSLSSGNLKDITAFDLLDISQVKLASTHLTLSKIFLAASDEPDDTYMQKHHKYKKLYSDAMDTFYLDVDEDDDGIQDTEEILAQNSVQMVRR